MSSKDSTQDIFNFIYIYGLNFRYLLGKEGFEHLDPFIPIHVERYSDKELKSCMEYYRERKWVTAYPGQDEEASFTSANNPYRLMELSAAL